jgi:PBSX family phage terminase large subunit
MMLSDRQTEAFDALEHDDITALLYGGAKGGGKSYFGCIWMFWKCCELIKKYNLKPTKFPPPVGFMGRKQSVDFSDTTLESWKSTIPLDQYELKAADKEIIIRNTVKVQYSGFDTGETVKRFNSAEYVYAFVDQAEEMTRDDYGLLRGTLRRKIKKQQPKYKILLTANPSMCWLKDDFINTPHSGNRFVQALPSDNPFLATGYVSNLREAFRHRPELIKAYVEGDWDIMVGSDIVIKPSWVRQAVDRKLHTPSTKRLVSCDPARFGDDETVIYVFEGPKVIDQMIYGQKSTMETAGELLRLQKKYNAKLIVVDGIGIGAGICDRLRELKAPLLEINSGSKASTEDKETKYVNRRAEMIWEAGEMFSKDEVTLPIGDQELINQLSNIKYMMSSNGKIKIESKDDIKERTSGKSPDRADAFVMGLHGLQFIREEAVDFKRQSFQPVQKPGYGWERQREAIYA